MARRRGSNQPTGAARDERPGLTSRQAEILGLTAAGLSGKQIAHRLGISVRTVEDHFSRIRDRTGTHSQAELLAYAVAAGIIRLDPAALPSHTGTPLMPVPPTPAGTVIGYARAATTGSDLNQQIQALGDAGCTRVFTDTASGKTTARPELRACLNQLTPGDVLVVASLDRLSRSLHELVNLVAGLCRRDLGFRSLDEALDTTTSDGRLVGHVFAALAELIHEFTAASRTSAQIRPAIPG